MDANDLPKLPEPYFWFNERDGSAVILYNHRHPIPPAEPINLLAGSDVEVIARATTGGYSYYYGFTPNLIWNQNTDSQKEAIEVLYGRFLLGERT